MALKFLNKKGWHTGSLRNIENVWKAEQKHDAEQKKLEELRKQIVEERDRAEFRQLQEQAGLIPKQERLDFLYESGLAVGKGSSGFKTLESVPKTEPETTASSSTSGKQQSAALGALFEEKPQTANDAWRKLHSDPLLLIRQREQEALARVKNNPVQMAMIRKSVTVEAKKGKDKDEKKHGKKHHRKKSKLQKLSSSENDSDYENTALKLEKRRDSHHKGSKTNKPSSKTAHISEKESSEEDARRKKYYDKEYKDRIPSGAPDTKYDKSDEDTALKVEERIDSHRQGSKINKPSSKTTHTSEEEWSEGDARRKKYYDKEYKDRMPRGAPDTKYDKKPDTKYDKKDEDTALKVEKQTDGHHKSSQTNKPLRRTAHTSEEESSEGDARRKKYYDKGYKDRMPSGAPDTKYAKSDDHQKSKEGYYDSRREEYSSERQVESRHDKRSHFNSSDKPPRNESSNKHRNPVKLSEEERAARLREMQMDAERHEQQRWKRLKKAADSDVQEASQDHASLGRNFLDAAQKSVYGAEQGGSSTIEESVRRRTHYLQRRPPTDSNAFRRS